MTLKRLEIPPGVIKADSAYSHPGRYIDTQWARFSGGKALKMGGWDSIADGLTGVCRGVCQWKDNSDVVRAAFGTTTKLYWMSSAFAISDITPLSTRTTSTLTDPIDTTNGSQIVTINHTGHGQLADDWVTLTSSTPVDDVTLAGHYQILTAGANDYTVAADTTATGSSSGGGTVAYVYYRKKLGNDPIASASGSPLFVISDSGHSATVGDTVIVTGATAVAGVTLSGAYVITAIAAAVSYTVNAGSNANATTTGGGAAVSVRNEINVGLESATSFFGTPARTWSLSSYGALLLANPAGGGLYSWSLGFPRALPLYRSPATMQAFFVTPERYIIALGINGDSLKMAWPDQEDPTDWTSTLSNTANEGRRVQGGSRLIAGRPVRNQVNILWTESAFFLHQWRPDDYVFSTSLMGDNAGICGANAHAVVGDVCYWLDSDFNLWKWDGAASKLPSDDIRDWFVARIDRTQRAKVFIGAVNAHDRELIILYQETGQTEINRYLLYNLDASQVWAVGTIDRTAWLDRVLFQYPIALSAEGEVFHHEFGVNGDGAAIDSYIEAGPVDIADGNVNMDAMAFWPDIDDQAGSLELTILPRVNAQDTPTVAGPFTLTTAGDPVDIREPGKMIGFKLRSNVVDGDWSMGINRADVQPAGARQR